MNDPIRDQLWSCVFAQAHAKGRLWFQCQEEADRATWCYDRRPAATQAPSAAKKEGQP